MEEVTCLVGEICLTDISRGTSALLAVVQLSRVFTKNMLSTNLAEPPPAVVFFCCL